MFLCAVTLVQGKATDLMKKKIPLTLTSSEVVDAPFWKRKNHIVITWHKNCTMPEVLYQYKLKTCVYVNIAFFRHQTE